MPLLVGVAVIPSLINQLGIERFGVLTLAWLFIGYFSMFDLGLGRALTKFVAARLGQGREDGIPPLIVTAIAIMNGVGILAALATGLLSRALVETWLNVSPSLRAEVIYAFWTLSASIPFVISSAGWRGILEAYHRFDWSNAIRIPIGILTFIGPFLAIHVSNGLLSVALVLAATRVLAWWAYRSLAFQLVPSLGSASLDFTVLKPLLSFGGWMTVTNIVGPLMVNVDRLLVGSLISVTAVAYYATPYEVVTKLWILPGAIVAVLFPKIAELLSSGRAAAWNLYRRTLFAVFLTMLPPTALIALFSKEGLTWWLGSEFAREGEFVAQCLTVAVFINCLAFVSHTTLQAGGKADWCAKVHLLELPLYLWLLVSLAEAYGINGVAIAWLVRVVIDAITMFLLTERLFGRITYSFVAILCASCAAVALLAIAAQVEFFWRVSITGIVTTISFILLFRMLGATKEGGMVKS